MARLLVHVGVGGPDGGDVVKVVGPGAVLLDEGGEETEVDQVEADGRPSETHGTL